ncbi:putative phage protein (predicted DNA packaging) [Scopulibacillus darangshiensis]|uniref:Putative phage protein (Predicted DNA packaging) n=1 Tax=Scopulibacillus darangshiensis TaxID=442528 RepID=A0A4R2PB04_9BACL|nr:head-tail connector protein [Scopulibacillus darangshiensis]TCP32182.1 putative phage protein (predicted DNA packaging) [Scopulibacillus darangshiensis]
MTLDEMKHYLRVDGADDDNEITVMMTMADQYLSNAGAAATQQELYDGAKKMLVSHWYDRREPVGQAKALIFSLESIIMQLKYCGVDAT